MYVPSTFLCRQSRKAETTFHYCWEIKSSFKLVWMESTIPCDSLIGYSLKWCCHSLVNPKGVRSANYFRYRKSANIRTYFYLRFADHPQMWQYADLRLAEPIIFADFKLPQIRKYIIFLRTNIKLKGTHSNLRTTFWTVLRQRNMAYCSPKYTYVGNKKY